MKKILLNISNHPSISWPQEQRKGWDIIADVPFPSINPFWDIERVKREVDKLGCEIWEYIDDVLPKDGEEAEIHFMLEGEYTFCYLMYPLLRKLGHIAIPTTKRKVVEDGNKKISTFEFVGWRIIE